jgi:hypothetical protein
MAVDAFMLSSTLPRLLPLLLSVTAAGHPCHRYYLHHRYR